MQGSTVLITGGAGAIGSSLAKHLATKNKVIVIDDLSSGRKKNIPPGAVFFHHDISQGLPDGLPDVHYIFHCAALFANQNSVEHPVRDLTVNALGTVLLLEYAKTQKNLNSFVYTSSSCVYGGEVSIPMKEEDAPGYLGTPYAVSKQTGEYYCKYYHHYWGLPTVSARLFNSYGPGEYPGQYRNVIPNFIDKALKGEYLTVTGTGDETRDFTYVGDVAAALIALAMSPKARGEVVNIGSGRETTVKELATSIFDLIPEARGLKYQSMRDWDHVKRRCADVTKLKNLIGFLPETNLMTGLEKTVAWHRAVRGDGNA